MYCRQVFTEFVYFSCFVIQGNGLSNLRLVAWNAFVHASGNAFVSAFVNAFVDAFVSAFVSVFVNAFVNAFLNPFVYYLP